MPKLKKENLLLKIKENFTSLNRLLRQSSHSFQNNDEFSFISKVLKINHSIFIEYLNKGFKVPHEITRIKKDTLDVSKVIC